MHLFRANPCTHILSTHSACFSGTVICDIAAHLPPDTLSGIVYLGGLPFIGPIMGVIGTPVIHGFLPGLFTTEDVGLSAKTAIDFVDSLFADPAAIPFEKKCAWIGSALLTTPQVRQLILTRPQDPTKLHALGHAGLPLLLVSGKDDSQVMGEVLAEEMRKTFTNMEVLIVDGAGHAVLAENPDEVLRRIASFATKFGFKVGSFDCGFFVGR